MGRLRLMRPRTLALRTVQRQTAASRSASPLIRLQQGSFGGVTLTQTPSLRASMGHLPPREPASSGTAWAWAWACAARGSSRH
ncbi:unnamed protein product [Spirodela intermedia]|uniref:Uncharacterized protein n=1 Tax=Spirodela intermedia TaxID=51605 RepID=A0A7I8J9Q2_SPIIN|nr:unnamed protein product [Spirodela intermedia]CAA6666810.1 unnamed protein product [Spirodela intermedia]